MRVQRKPVPGHKGHCEPPGESSYADAAKPWEDWDDPEDVKVTNRTDQDYRSHTGKGGHFMALTPIQLTGQKLLVPVQ